MLFYLCLSRSIVTQCQKAELNFIRIVIVSAVELKLKWEINNKMLMEEEE